MEYKFASEQLRKLLEDVVDLYVEYVEAHGKDRVRAKHCASSDTLEGLDAERELIDIGEMQSSTGQIYQREQQDSADEDEQLEFICVHDYVQIEGWACTKCGKVRR